MHHAATPGVTQAIDRALTGAGAQGAHVARELSGVVDLLDASGSLRRALTDAMTTPDDRAALVEHVFGGRIGPRARAVVAAAARHRWRSDRDLAGAVERGAAQAALTAAEADGALGRVEQELFAFGRVLAASRSLRAALSDVRATPEARAALVADLLGDRAHPMTLQAVQRMVATPRARSLTSAITALGRLAAEQHSALVATATTAVRLTEDQAERLRAALTRIYGREVRVNNAVDPAVIGGVQVQVGDELVDGTVLARLDDVRRQLAG